jgi:hypothetical protein
MSHLIINYLIQEMHLQQPRRHVAEDDLQAYHVVENEADLPEVEPGLSVQMPVEVFLYERDIQIEIL